MICSGGTKRAIKGCRINAHVFLCLLYNFLCHLRLPENVLLIHRSAVPFPAGEGIEDRSTETGLSHMNTICDSPFFLFALL